MKYDIFISYSRKDIEFARKVCAVLDSYKQYYDFEYFFDQSEITSANEYLDRISSAIYDSKAVLFIASKDAYASKFCAKELLYADNKNKSIHQYRIDKADVPQKLEMLLGTHQYRELSSTPIESEVREVLKEVLGGNVLSLEELKAKESKHKDEDHDVQPTTQTEDESSNHHRNRGWLKRPAVWLSAVAILVIALLTGLVLSPNAKETYEVVVEESKVENVADKRESDTPADPIVEETKYSVGDFYDDGTKQGVVFEVSGDRKHGKIVSLYEERLPWCTEEQYDKDIRVGVTSVEDGKTNTDIVMQRSDCAKYPAFTWCREQGEEWYLPSRNELKELHEVKDVVNRTLTKYSFEAINNGGGYWSSTESCEFCAWLVYMNAGYLNNYKNINYYVRAVSAF